MVLTEVFALGAPEPKRRRWPWHMENFQFGLREARIAIANNNAERARVAIRIALLHLQD